MSLSKAIILVLFVKVMDYSNTLDTYLCVAIFLAWIINGCYCLYKDYKEAYLDYDYEINNQKDI